MLLRMVGAVPKVEGGAELLALAAEEAQLGPVVWSPAEWLALTPEERAALVAAGRRLRKEMALDVAKGVLSIEGQLQLLEGIEPEAAEVQRAALELEPFMEAAEVRLSMRHGVKETILG